MFICWHVLLRAYIPRHALTLHVARRSLPLTLSLSRSGVHTSASEKFAQSAQEERSVHKHPHTFSDEGAQSPKAERAEEIPAERDLRPPWLLDQTPMQAETKGSRQEKRDAGAHLLSTHQVRSYLAQREQGVLLFRDHSIDQNRIFEVLEEAAGRRRKDVIKYLVADVLENGHYAGLALRARVIQELLILTSEGLVDRKQAFFLLENLRSLDRLMTLALQTRLDIAEALLSMPPDPDVDPQLLDILADLFLDLVNKGSNRFPESPHLTTRPAALLYLLAYDLAAIGLQERSLVIVRTLVSTQKLSSHAIHRADLSSGNFAHIVWTMLVQSSTVWGWRPVAGELVQRMLPAANPITRDMGETAVDVLRLLVSEPTQGTLRSATAIIVQLMERCPSYQIPAAIMQDFYAAAEHLDSPELAETVYGISQSDLVRNGHQHTYLPPVKGTLYWFLKYLTNTNKNVHLARVLATQVVDDNIVLPLQFRGPVISVIAAYGLATHASTLWKRYEKSKGRAVVVGNAPAMVRLVSLFVSLSRRMEYIIAREAASQSALSPSEVVEIAASTIRRENLNHQDKEDASSGTSFPVTGVPACASRHSPDDNLNNTQVPNLQEDVMGMNGPHELSGRVAERALAEEPVQARAAGGNPKVDNELADAGRASSDNLPPKSDPLQSQSAALTEPEVDEQTRLSTLTIDEAKQKHTEFKGFAELVFEAFRAVRSPYSRMHHWELNALARAAFMLGRLEVGLRIFKHILSTRQVPDLTDVNVALAILAEYDPTSAARVIERMVKMGLQPDCVSFGTVIHHAIVHGDTPLASALIRRSRALGLPPLTYKTIGSLLRAAVTLVDEDGRLTPVDNLHTTSDLVDSLLQARRVPSPGMGRDCIIAALRADDPRMAFRFWKLLVKDKVQWDDNAQVKTRKSIARRIRRHVREGFFDKWPALAMLHELEEPPSVGRVMSAGAREGLPTDAADIGSGHEK